MAYTVLPPKDFVDGLGYSFLESALLNKAEGLFMMNLQNYPKSPVVYSAMGDLYTKKGDKQKAITFYRKSLALKNDPVLQKKVSALASNQK
jgi:Tfp pilus assembly protein PilF